LEKAMDAEMVMARMRPWLATMAIVALMAASTSAAERVSFEQGAGTATVSGRVEDSHDYALRVQAGQTLTVALKATPGVYFNVMAPGYDTALVNTFLTGDSTWSGKLPTTGDYVVQVYQMRSATRQGKDPGYAVTFTVE
jgi:hypothetical protein